MAALNTNSAPPEVQQEFQSLLRDYMQQWEKEVREHIAEYDKVDKAEQPPNLRDAEGEERCGTCGYFNPKGKCQMFSGYPVDASEVCDEYVAGEPGTMGTVEKILRQEGSSWHVYSHDGSKHLGGPYDTKAEAVERLRQIEYFKHIKKFNENHDELGRFSESDSGGASDLNVPSDLKLEGGNFLGVTNNLGTKFDGQARAVRAALDGIPANMRLAGGASARVTLRERPKDVPKSVQASYTPAGTSPSGYLYSYPVKGLSPDEHGGNAVHEYGHAVDHWVGINNGGMKNLSEHPGFREAVKRDVEKLSSFDKGMRYYHVVSDARETFAETFANIAGAKERSESNDVYLAKFPQSAAWIKGALKL